MKSFRLLTTLFALMVTLSGLASTTYAKPPPLKIGDPILAEEEKDDFCPKLTHVADIVDDFIATTNSGNLYFPMSRIVLYRPVQVYQDNWVVDLLKRHKIRVFRIGDFALFAEDKDVFRKVQILDLNDNGLAKTTKDDCYYPLYWMTPVKN